jgi:glycosyltransferase involved in cell wall biosynthesis
MKKIYNSQTSVFETNPHRFGGTEFMLKNFKEHVLSEIPKINNYHCILLPGKISQKKEYYLKSNKQIIIWMHNLTEQFGYVNTTNQSIVQEYFNDLEFVKKIKYVIVVSQFAKKELLEKTLIDESQIFVIYNAIDPVLNNSNRFKDIKRIKMIHTSSADRGFEIIAQSLKYIDHDFRLNVFNNIHPDKNEVNDFYKKIYKDSRLFFYGDTPKKTIMNELSTSHIFLYPSIYKETFCLSQVEAISAGCLPIYRKYGSLEEVSLNSGISYEIEEEKHFSQEHVKIFAQKVNDGIELIKSNVFNIETKSKEVNDLFSWNNFKNSWFQLHKTL